MTILPILIAPHPTLEKACVEVPPEGFGPDLNTFCDDMVATMLAAPGSGLAAPQVGDLRRIVVVHPNKDSPTDKMVNPRITKAAGRTVDVDEACLSVPGVSTRLERARSVSVTWSDPLTGLPHSREFHGFGAVVVQHEIDHLNGKTILPHLRRFVQAEYLAKRARVP